MLVKWPLRAKLFVGLGLLLAMVAILSSSGLYSAYAYRTLVKTLSSRVSELPLAAEMSARAADMRLTLAELRGGPARRRQRSARRAGGLRSTPHSDGPAAASRPARRRGRRPERILRPVGRKAQGGRQHRRHPAGATGGAANRSRLGGDSPHQQAATRRVIPRPRSTTSTGR